MYTVFFPLTDNCLCYFTIFSHWRQWFLYELLLPIYCSVNYFFPLIPLSTIPCNVLLSISRLFIDNTHCTVHYHADLVPIQIHVLPTVLHVLRYLQWRTFKNYLPLSQVPHIEFIGRGPFCCRLVWSLLSSHSTILSFILVFLPSVWQLLAGKACPCKMKEEEEGRETHFSMSKVKFTIK